MPLSIGDNVKILSDDKTLAFGMITGGMNNEGKYKVKIKAVLRSKTFSEGDEVRISAADLEKVQGGGKRKTKTRKSKSGKRKTYRRRH